jgi:hypothetical protein
MTTINTIQSVKSLFKSNFTPLFDGKLIELNEATIKVIASYEDGEGGFCEPELIMDCFNNKIDDDAIATMLEAIEEEWVEVEFKKENDDYVITAGNNEAVYVIRLQIFRIK